MELNITPQPSTSNFNYNAKLNIFRQKQSLYHFFLYLCKDFLNQ
jgi:hypothetical protein